MRCPLIYAIAIVSLNDGHTITWKEKKRGRMEIVLHRGELYPVRGARCFVGWACLILELIPRQEIYTRSK